jgi:hypothetical protein
MAPGAVASEGGAPGGGGALPGVTLAGGGAGYAPPGVLGLLGFIEFP